MWRRKNEAVQVNLTPIGLVIFEEGEVDTDICSCQVLVGIKAEIRIVHL